MNFHSLSRLCNFSNNGKFEIKIKQQIKGSLRVQKFFRFFFFLLWDSNSETLFAPFFHQILLIDFTPPPEILLLLKNFCSYHPNGRPLKKQRLKIFSPFSDDETVFCRIFFLLSLFFSLAVLMKYQEKLLDFIQIFERSRQPHTKKQSLKIKKFFSFFSGFRAARKKANEISWRKASQTMFF